MTQKRKSNGLAPKYSLFIFYLLLLLQFPITSVYAEADNDWIVRLRQSEGTRAQVTGGWTLDGERIDHPSGFYTLSCEGEEKTLRIPKEDIATQPNDADYEIEIWWPDDTYEKHELEKIPAPGSKEYSHSLISVVFEVFEATTPPTREPPTVSEWGLIIMALLLVTVGAIVIMRRSKVRLA